MPFVALNQDSGWATPAYVSSIDGTMDVSFRQYFESDIVRSILNDLRIAGVTYPLRRPCPASYIPGVGEFLVEGFSPVFVGRGATIEEARSDWLLAVHAGFQELISKRPFEMAPSDVRRWHVLTSQIDVTVYRNQTPILVRQFGKVTQARPYPQQIQWENGEREAISVEQVESPDFITFKPGQPIEAVVARDPLNFHLLRIVHIERRSTPSRLLPTEEAELLESIGSSQHLPPAGWE
ncbi:MAG: hypothetical protein JSS27_15900 [Planctomycetes bacterium]|nr:hypothetical protein [Planctomycetota bacterium]